MPQASDRREFDRLMLASIPASLALATKLTGSADAAEDLMQTALLHAARSAHTFRGQSTFKTWFTRILINCFRDWLAAAPQPATVPSADLPDADTPHPIAALLATEFSTIVAQAVSSLPPRQREVLVLHSYENLDTAQIAAVLETTPAAVRKNLQLARDRLRPLLDRYLTFKER